MKAQHMIAIILFLVLIQMTLGSKQIECEEIVQCVWTSNSTCVIYHSPTHPTENCKIIFNETADKNARRLRLWLKNSDGSDSLSDLSDAVSKFRNLDTLLLGFNRLKNVERARLTAFRNIKNLYLLRNEISQLRSDTFDDLKNLKVLHLQHNQIEDLHVNLFNELHNLEELALNSNRLEIIPYGLFHSNAKLQRIYLQNNKIWRIVFDFRNLPRLASLNLEGNDCINEKFDLQRIFQHSFNERIRHCYI